MAGVLRAEGEDVIAEAWRSANREQWGIRIGGVEQDGLDAKAKTIDIDLDGEIHRCRITRYPNRKLSVISGDVFREWLEKRDALEWGHTDRPTFDLVEIMVPANERRLWRLVG